MTTVKHYLVYFNFGRMKFGLRWPKRWLPTTVGGLYTAMFLLGAAIGNAIIVTLIYLF